MFEKLADTLTSRTNDKLPVSSVSDITDDKLVYYISNYSKHRASLSTEFRAKLESIKINKVGNDFSVLTKKYGSQCVLIANSRRPFLYQVVYIFSKRAKWSSLLRMVHATGDAIDCIPKDGYENGRDPKKFFFYTNCKANNILCGADWTGFYDPYHFYIDTSRSRTLWIKWLVGFILLITVLFFLVKKYGKNLFKKKVR